MILAIVKNLADFFGVDFHYVKHFLEIANVDIVQSKREENLLEAILTLNFATILLFGKVEDGVAKVFDLVVLDISIIIFIKKHKNIKCYVVTWIVDNLLCHFTQWRLLLLGATQKMVIITIAIIIAKVINF